VIRPRQASRVAATVGSPGRAGDLLLEVAYVTTTLTLDLESLDDEVIGPVLAGGTAAAAEEAATFNLAVTHHPAVVVGAATAEDVVTAVRFAARIGLPVAVQATGHGPVKPADGALLISTSRMRAVSIDPVRRSARVEAGTRWRDVIDAASVHGLAPLCGSSSQVGVVGYTLGGGIGLLSRQYGFAADLVTTVDVVTADGRLRTVDATSDPELFWAIRGGKGNFGIVTAVEFGLVPVREIFAGSVFWDGAHAPAVLDAYRRWTVTLPETATTSVAVLRLPPHDAVPAPLRGKTFVHLRFAHNGDAEEGARLLRPMTAVAPSLVQMVGPMPFTAADAVHADPTDPLPAWDHSLQLRDLTEGGVEALLRAAAVGTDSPLAMVEVRQLGGALSRQPAVPNAVAGRDGRFSIWLLGIRTPDTEGFLVETGRRLAAELRPWATGTALLNFLGDATTPELVAAAWSPDDTARLRDVKHRVDPTNVFRFGSALV
jgi:FAD/FMN-containing dehydrogenase